MGTYCTFFTATDADLRRLFPGWKAPKPKKEKRQGVNPFTKQPIVVKAWVPAEPVEPLTEPNLYTDAWGPAVEPVRMGNDYLQHIELAGAPGLRALPHFRDKNVDRYAFQSLGELSQLIIGGKRPTPPALLGDPDDDNIPVVDVLSAKATAKLAQMDEDALAALAQKVAESNLDIDGGGVSEATLTITEDLLPPLQALARDAVARGARLCSYVALHY